MAEREKARGKWYRQADSNTVLVLLHGITSDSEKCWRSKTAYWPHLISLETDFASVGIYLFAYHSHPWSADYSIDDAVDALEEYAAAHGLLHFKNVVFLCHSMGGIIARRFLVLNQDRFAERKIGVGFVLVASPSRGSKFADWLAPLLKAIGQSQALALRTQEKNPWLNTLDQQFLELLGSGKIRIHGKELVEDRPLARGLHPFGPVVRAESAASYFPDPVKIFGSDHRTIAAPANADDFQHVVFATFLRDFLRASRDPDLQEDDAALGSVQPFEPDGLIEAVDTESLFTRSAEMEQLFRAGAPVKCFRLARTLTRLLVTDLEVNDRSSERWLRCKILSDAILFGIRASSYFPEKAQLLSFLSNEVSHVAERNLLLKPAVQEIIIELAAINQGNRNYRVAGDLLDQIQLQTHDPVLQTKIRSRMYMADISLGRDAFVSKAILQDHVAQADRKHDLRMPTMEAWEAFRTGAPSVARTVLEGAEHRLTKANELYGSGAFDPMMQIETRLSLKCAIRQTEHHRTVAEQRNDDALWELYRRSSRQQPIMLRSNMWDLIGGFDSSRSRDIVWEIRDLHDRYNQTEFPDSESLNRMLEDITVRLVRVLSEHFHIRRR